jgi:hypothetical protein
MREKEIIRIVGLTYTAVLQPRNKGAVNKYVICTKEIIEEEIHRKIALIFNTYEFFNFTKAISPSFTVKEDIEFNIVSFSVNSIFDIRNPIYITYDKVPGFQDINYLFSNVKVR